MAKQSKGTKALEPLALEVGRVVPGLDGVRWIQGKPVSLGAKRTLIECFVDNCYGSEEPYLCQLSKAHRKKLVVCSLCQDTEANRAYLEGLGESVYYPVALCSEALWDAYMRNTARVPHAFLVNEQGRLLWNGNPYVLDGELDAFLDDDHVAELLSFADKRDRAHALHREARGRVATNPHREEVRALAREAFARFEDDATGDLLSRYDRLLLGEPCPALGKLQWVQGKAEPGSKPRLLALFAVQEGFDLERFGYVQRCFEELGDAVDVVGLSKSPREELKTLLEEHEGLRFPVATVQEKVFAQLVTERTRYNLPACFFVDADGTFLWSGEARSAFALAQGLGASGVRRADFEALNDAAEFSREALARRLRGEALSDDEYLRLQECTRAQLARVPCDEGALRVLLEFAQQRGAEEVLRQSAWVDLSRLDASMLFAMADELHYLDDATMPWETLFTWLRALLERPDARTPHFVYVASKLEHVGHLAGAVAVLERARAADPEDEELTENLERLRALRSGTRAALAWLASQPAL